MSSANMVSPARDEMDRLDSESIKVTKRRGPSIDPCGTPEVTLAVAEAEPYKTTHWERSER